MKIYFEPTFDDLDYKYVMELFENRFKCMYQFLYPFEHINMYRTIVISDSEKATVYINPYNLDTINLSEKLCKDNYTHNELYNLADAIITNGNIVKDVHGND